jgi:protein arginine N-methyltransferase 5
MEESLPWDPCAIVSTFLGLPDIAKASPSFGFSSRRAKSFPSDRQESDDTPVLRLLSELRAKGYRQVCMPLTNERWKTRWEGMCLLPAESTEEDKELAAKDAEAWRMTPGFKKDEVTISRLGAC